MGDETSTVPKAGETPSAWLSRTSSTAQPLPTPGLGPDAVPQDPAPKPGERPADWLGRTTAASDPNFEVIAGTGLNIPVDRAARILKAQSQSGYSTEFIDKNLDAVEGDIKRSGFDVERLRAGSPLTAQFLKENPARVGLFAADLRGLTDNEKMLAMAGDPDVKLRAFTPKEIQDQAERLADQQDQEWLASPMNALGKGTHNLAEDHSQRVQQNIDRIRAEESVIAKAGQIGPGEVLSNKLRENPFFLAPMLSAVDPLEDTFNNYMAAKRMEASKKQGTKVHSAADEELLVRAYRYQLAKARRGETTGGEIANLVSDLPAFVGSLAMTGALSKGVTGLAGGVSEGVATEAGTMAPGIAARAVGVMAQAPFALPGQTVESALKLMTPTGQAAPDENGNFTYQVDDGTGKTAAVAIPQALIGSMIDVGTANINFNPIYKLWAGKVASPSVGGFLRDVSRKGMEGVLSFIGVNEVAKLAKAAVGIQPYELPSWQNLKAQAAVGGVLAAGHRSFERYDAWHANAKAQTTADTIGKVSENVKEMAASKASPEEIQKAIAAQVKGTDSEHTYLPAADFAVHFEQQGIDPHELATELTGDPMALEDALRDGHDLQVPTGAYIAKIGATPDGAFFQPKLRLDPAAPNLDESQKHLAELDSAMEAERKAKAEARAEAAAKKAEGTVPAEEPPTLSETIGKNVRDQLEAAGFKAEAKQYQALIESGFKQFSEKAKASGIDPEAFLKRFTPRVERGTPPEGEGQYVKVMDQSGTHVEKVAGDTPADAVLEAHRKWADATIEPMTDEEVKNFLPLAMERPDSVVTLDQPGKAKSPKLSALHNMTEENLAFADQLGGLAVPSIGVVPENTSLRNYGPITLIGRKSLGDPGQVPVFDADAYSPTFPRPEYRKVPVKTAQPVVNEFKDVSKRFDERSIVDTVWDNAVNSPDPERTVSDLLRSPAAQALFLETKGERVEPVTKTVGAEDTQAPFIESPSFKKFVEEGNYTHEKISPRDNPEAYKEFSRIVAKAIDEYADRLPEDGREDVRELYKKEFIDPDTGEVFFGRTQRIERAMERVGKAEVQHEDTRQLLNEKLKGKESEFKAWVEDKILSMYEAPQLTVGGRKQPYSLDSIVERMTGRVRGQEKNLTFGEGAARAVASKRFSNLEQMRRAAGENIQDEAAVSEGRKQAKKLMEEYRDKVLKYSGDMSTWDALDASMRAMAKWAKTGAKDERSMRSALASEGFHDVSEGVLGSAVDAGRAWLKAPVPYFEAKPQRAVSLSEFAGAVIPKNATAETRRILDEHKIPYREYDDAHNETQRFNTVSEFRRQMAREGKDVLFQPGEGDEPRGQIRIGNSAISINLLEKADPSTFLHETGHLYLEMLGDLAGHEKAADQVKGDFATVLDWLGVKDRSEIGRIQHEQFARGFEAYLMKGEAPSSKLRLAFDRFKSWLLEIYKNIRNLDVELNPKVRGVFDRLLASDEEIQSAYEARGRREAFLSAAPDLKMSDADAAKYADLIEQAHEAAKNQLDNEALADIRQQETEKYQRAREATRKAVEEEVNALPEQVALARLQRHRTPDGKELPPGTPKLKLDRASIDPEVLKKLPRGVTGQDGLTPDGAAEQLGFPSGEALLSGLQRAVDVEGYGIPSPREVEIRTNLAHLEATRKALEMMREPLETEAKEATADAMAGKKAIARELAKSMRQEERAKIRDLEDMLREIRDRGGIRPTDPKTEQLPRKYRASGSGGVGSDEVAQELYDRGILKDATSDDLYDWLQMVDGQVKASRERLKAIAGEANDLAKRKVKESLEAFVENAKQQEKLREELDRSAAERRTLEGGIIKNPREAIIERTTNERMAATHPKPVEALDEKALEAIHNDKEAKVKAYEIKWLLENKPNALKGLLRVVTDPVKYVQSVRDYADQKMIGETDRATAVGKYQTGERQARIAAREALLKNDIDGAIGFKQRELLNHELFRAATEMKQDVRKIAKYMRRFSDKDVLAEIGKADPASRDQLIDLARRFEFSKDSAAKRASKQLLIDFLKDKMTNGVGEEFQTPSFIQDTAFQVNYQDLKYGDLLALRDFAKQIETTAKLTNYSMHLEKRVTREEMKRGFIEGVKKNAKERGPQATESAMSALDRIFRLGRQINAGLIRTEQWVREADAADIMGPVRKYLFNGSVEAQKAELDLQVKVGALVVKAIETLPADLRKGLSEKIVMPARRPITMYDVFGFAAQAGNASNWSKFIQGEQMRTGGHTQSEIIQLIHRLTPEHAKVIQEGIWDAQETLWPLIDEKHQKWTGLKLPKVEAAPQHSLFAGMRGGYMPVIYEAGLSKQGQMQEAARVGELQADGYHSATIASSHRKARIEEFARPMDTDLRNLPSHVSTVIKDLTHREWMVDANYLLNDEEVRAAVRDHYGPEMIGRLEEWVKQTVNSRNQSSVQSTSGLRRVYEGTRLNMVSAMMLLKATTLLKHATSSAAAVDMIGNGDLVKGAKYYAMGIEKSLRPRAAYDEMVAKSVEMPHFLENNDREMRENIERLKGKTGTIAKVQMLGSYAIGMMNLSRAMPAWWGEYFRAMDEFPKEKGLSGAELEKYACMSADEVVRSSIGTSHAKDLSAVMAAKGDLMRAFTLGYTPGMILYSRLRDVGSRFANDKNIPRLIAGLFMAGIVAGTLHEAVGGNFPNTQKDEGWGPWWLKSIGSYFASALPMGRDAVEYLLHGRESSSVNPMVHDAKLIMKAVESGAGVYNGDDPEKFIVDSARAAEYFSGLPTDQALTTGQYMYDLQKGNAEMPNDIWTFYHDFLHGQHRKK